MHIFNNTITYINFVNCGYLSLVLRTSNRFLTEFFMDIPNNIFLTSKQFL